MQVALESGPEPAEKGEMQQVQKGSLAQDPLHPLPRSCDGTAGRIGSVLGPDASDQPPKAIPGAEAGIVPRTDQRVTAMPSSVVVNSTSLPQQLQPLSETAAECVRRSDHVPAVVQLPCQPPSRDAEVLDAALNARSSSAIHRCRTAEV